MNENKDLLYDYLTNHNLQSYDLLMKNNLKLVLFVINHFFKSQNKTAKELYDDYIGVGYIGLSKAINSFDITKIDEINFTTYASSCIKNELRTYLRDEAKFKEVISFETVVNDPNDDPITLKETIADEENNIEEALESIFTSYRKEKILLALASLEKRDREVIELFYGFNGEKLTQREIALRFNTTRSNIAMIISRNNKLLYGKLYEFRNYYNSMDERTSKANENDIVEDIEDLDSKLNELYRVYGQEKVNLCINKLSKNQKQVLQLYLGIEGGKKYLKEEIATIVKYDVDLVNIILHRGYHKLVKTINNNTVNKDDRYSRIIAIYGKELINEFISSLSIKDREVFTKYYGIGTEVSSASQLAKIYKVDVYRIINACNEELTYLKYSKLETIDELKIFEEKIDRKELIKLRRKLLYEDIKDFSKDSFESAFILLDEKEQDILMHYYGLNKEIVYKIEEFAVFSKLDFKSSKQIIDNVIHKANYLISNSKKTGNKRG